MNPVAARLCHNGSALRVSFSLLRLPQLCLFFQNRLTERRNSWQYLAEVWMAIIVNFVRKSSMTLTGLYATENPNILSVSTLAKRL